MGESSTCSEFRSKLTLGLLKSILIVFLLDTVHISMTIYNYLHLVNMFDILSKDDAATYTRIVGFTDSLIKIPLSLLLDYFFRIPPKILIPGMYLTKGISLLAYGLVIYQSSWSPELRLGIAYLVTVPLQWSANFHVKYLWKHLTICLSEKYEVKKGVLNSTVTLLGAFTSMLQILAVGQVYKALSLEAATLYLCIFGTALALVMGVIARPVFGDLKPIPPRQSTGSNYTSVLGNLRVQFKSFWSCRIYKVMLSEVLDNSLIGEHYVNLFFFSAGLAKVTMTYIKAIQKAIKFISCLLNIIKYNYAWGRRFSDVFIIGHGIALINCTYIFVAWLDLAWFNTLVKPTTMPTWMMVYFGLYLGTFWITNTMTLMKKEFFQEEIPAADRGSIAGVKMLLTVFLVIAQTTTNVLMPNEYLYLVNFAFTVLIDATTLGIVTSYKIDEVRERKEERLIPEELSSVGSEEQNSDPPTTSKHIH